MNDRFRVSDADRDRVAGLLRDHYAEGRLSADELDERLTAALNARTSGDLRRVLADLPGPGAQPGPGTVFPPLASVFPPGAAMFPPGDGSFPRGGLRPRVAAPLRVRRRGLRVFPLIALALIAALLIPGTGPVIVAILQAVLLLWLVACLAGIFIAARFYRRVRRDWRSAQLQYRIQHWTDGFTRP